MEPNEFHQAKESLMHSDEVENIISDEDIDIQTNNEYEDQSNTEDAKTNNEKGINQQESEITINENTQKRSIFNRFFGKLEPGSMRGSILSLSILSVGVGCLSLPQRVGQMSILLCSIEIILSGIAAIWTLEKIIDAGRKAGLTEYSKTIIHYCGEKWGKFADISIIIYIFGIMIVYQIISKSYSYSLIM